MRASGAQIMPFSLDRTLHTFDKTPDGGIQRVRVRAAGSDKAGSDQIEMIRSHLHAIAQALNDRNFSAPAHIHGADMPGMGEMKSASAGELSVIYRDLDDGAQLDYVARSPRIVAAVHRWFDAQLADHGRDATTTTRTEQGNR